jgi:predicted GIY-YIG superfamily endonuclease
MKLLEQLKTVTTVYMLKSAASDVVYYGSSCQPRQRWINHKHKSAKSHLQVYVWMRSVGVENVQMYLLKTFDTRDKAYKYENMMINDKAQKNCNMYAACDGICPHGRQRLRCIPCGGTPQIIKKCIHGKQKCHCIPCGGKKYECIHGKQRSRCVPCGGTLQIRKKCIHGKQRSRCIPCGGTPYKCKKRRLNSL